jgi:hypothetical protein
MCVVAPTVRIPNVGSKPCAFRPTRSVRKAPAHGAQQTSILRASKPQPGSELRILDPVRSAKRASSPPLGTIRENGEGHGN